ncbi:hypothetical protein AcdelDRAFT_0052 [Acidovorax delafieldii 2AN]|uniref:TM2 domain-containing protein n=1 Tax=Acidovorax delafieldii 2AN TaxID=573060 RepID=C5SZH2_ACIDE|nr:hypothetical protein AcdelDRAFT_0052 [Acidovorax delafieldii 2AN]
MLALLQGGIGIHKFHTGAWGWGIVNQVLCWIWIPCISALAEGIRYIVLPDAEVERKAAKIDGPFVFL